MYRTATLTANPRTRHLWCRRAPTAPRGTPVMVRRTPTVAPARCLPCGAVPGRTVTRFLCDPSPSLLDPDSAGVSTPKHPRPALLARQHQGQFMPVPKSARQ